MLLEKKGNHGHLPATNAVTDKSERLKDTLVKSGTNVPGATKHFPIP